MPDTKDPLLTNLVNELKGSDALHAFDLNQNPSDATHKNDTTPKKSSLNIWRSLNVFALLVLAGSVGFSYFYFPKEIQKFKTQNSSVRRQLREIRNSTWMTMPLLGGTPVPAQLRSVPWAENAGIVLETRTVNIRNVLAAYNASIVNHNSGYLLFFRQDVFNRTREPCPFYSYLGVVELDRNFEQTTKEYTRIDTNSDYSEDPRAFKIADQLYLSYNDVRQHTHHSRSIRVARLNLEDYSLDFSTNLDLNQQRLEKNWTPFEYVGEDGKPHLYIEYHLSPHKLLELPEPDKPLVNSLNFPDHPSLPMLPWKDTIWGLPRGGAAPQRIGDEYLGFFHSSFKDEEGISWYLMGAYTFEAKAPFALTGISHYPILFKGIYDSPPLNTANPNLRCIFPAGFAFENRDGKELIHVSCGENDSNIKILTMDKEALLKSLHRF